MSEKKGFFKRLAQGLSKTRDNIASSFDSIFSGFSGIDEDFYEELEEILIMSDMGIDTTMNIIEDLKKKVKENKIKEPEECRQLLIDSIKDQMRLDDSAYDFIDKKSVVLVIGVNGVGKTTSVGKLAASLKGQGKKVLLQLRIHSVLERSNSSKNGQIVLGLISSVKQRVQILRLLYMMR